jgi:PAS domain S-box-containing protein
MPCHGDPQQAPDFIKEMFPPERDQAYHYQLGEVIGAVSVSIPMSEILQRLHANLNRDLLANGVNFLALITCLGILIRFAVTRPLGRLGEVTSEILRTGRFDRVLPRRGRDEIGRLIDSFNEMVAGLGEKTRELEESEQRFRLLTDNAGDGIISFLENGKIILFNRRAEKLFGYSKREVLGMDVAKLVHPDATKSLHEIGTAEYLRLHEDDLMNNIHRIIGRRRDGSPIEMEVSLSLAVSDGHKFHTAIIRFKEPGTSA